MEHNISFIMISLRRRKLLLPLWTFLKSLTIQWTFQRALLSHKIARCSSESDHLLCAPWQLSIYFEVENVNLDKEKKKKNGSKAEVQLSCLLIVLWLLLQLLLLLVLLSLLLSSSLMLLVLLKSISSRWIGLSYNRQSYMCSVIMCKFLHPSYYARYMYTYAHT